MEQPQINSFKDLVVWQAAMDLAVFCYEQTKRFPVQETYGLTSQIRRAAASVPANIAEGHGREGAASFIQFLRIAQGSLKELETHLILASRVGLLRQEDTDCAEQRINTVGKMLRSLVRSLQGKK